MDRRITLRARLGERSLFLNKYVDGYPHLAELLDVSETGMLLRVVREPWNRETTFALELGIPGSQNRMWLWAETIRKSGSLQAVRIAHADLLDRAQLRQLVRWNAAA